MSYKDLVVAIELCGLDVIQEFKFHPHRRFKFDFACPQMKLGIEYEGICSGKSRHTTIKGYTNDCTKYNIATNLGWKVLRFTALHSFEEILGFIEDAKNHNQNVDSKMA